MLLPEAPTDYKLAPAAIIASGLSFAGLGEAGWLDVLPKGAVLTLVTFMFGIILFFVKRDYSRITDGQAANAKAVSELRESGAKAMSELRTLVEAQHTALLLQLNDCIKVKDFGVSISRVQGKVNSVNTRLVVLETKAGLRNKVTEDEDVEQEQVPDEDKTPVGKRP